MKRAARFPKTMGIATRIAYAHGKAAGVTMGPLLELANLSRRQIEDPDVPIPVSDQVTFLNLVAIAVDDDLLGVHLAKRCELRRMGLFYYVLASSATLLDACQRAARFSTMVNEGAAQKFIDGRSIGIGVKYIGVSRHQDRQQVEFWFSALIRLARQLTGVYVVPQRLRLSHARMRGAREMAAYFGCAVEYGASVDEIQFTRKSSQLPVVNADPYLNRLLVKLCEEAVANRAVSRGSMRTQVENAIVTALPHGSARASAIAKTLGLSQRTLARHLTQEGTTFSNLLNEIRRRLAARYLEDESLSISQIAWLLGYHDIGAFSHAFKQWTGRSPRATAATARGVQSVRRIRGGQGS
jgi:AraC-like DNA-binding protein